MVQVSCVKIECMVFEEENTKWLFSFAVGAVKIYASNLLWHWILGQMPQLAISICSVWFQFKFVVSFISFFFWTTSSEISCWNFVYYSSKIINRSEMNTQKLWIFKTMWKYILRYLVNGLKFTRYLFVFFSHLPKLMKFLHINMY